MPELPEVETICRGLAKVLPGRKIQKVALGRDDLRIPFPRDLASIEKTKVKNITRRAKYIVINLNDGRSLLIHLGMSGRIVTNPEKRNKHDHMILKLDNGAEVVFNDPRRFGMVGLCKTDELENHKFFKHLGLEPLEPTFNAEYLLRKLKNKKPAIKVAIMDQRIVVGIGNIYASEALYEAGIDPRRAASSITKAEAAKLVKAICLVLKKAIKAGGSSLRDYVQADGELGYFQHHFAVYDKEGQKCPRCKTPCIQRITQGGRSTFYCRKNQK